MDEIRKKITYIIKTTKKVVETVFSDYEEKQSFKELFPKEELPKINEKGKEYRNYSLDLFVNASQYYNDLF